MRRTTLLRPKQSLGQNFLRDNNIARNIVASLHAQPSDVILEIGPGEGALTRYMVPLVQRLIVVDVDERVIVKMTADYPADRIEVLHQDVLETDLQAIAAGRGVERIRIIGNIPYNITSPILFHILDNRSAVADATLMMQKEVALRLVAAPRSKEYGILAVFCRMFTDAEILFDVSPACFYPPPKVTSSVVRLRILPRPRYAIKSETVFRAMVRSVFGKRRKTLRKSLSYFVDSVDPLSTVMDLSRRPEELSVEELAELSNAVSEKAILTKKEQPDA